MKINFTRNTIKYILLAIVSLVLTVFGALSLSRSGNVVSITELKPNMIKKGQYVDLTDITVRPYKTLVDGSVVTNIVRMTEVGFSQDYDYTLASLQDDGYIYVMVKSEGNDTGTLKDTAGITGQVIKPHKEIPNLNVYSLEDTDIAVSELVIKEVDVDQRNVMLFPGVFFLILSIILIFREKPY